MGSTLATQVADAVALTTSFADVFTINTSMADFITIGWTNLTDATAQNVEVRFAVNGQTIYSAETGLPQGAMTPTTVAIPVADSTGACFKIDTWAVDELTVSMRGTVEAKTLDTIWVVLENSSSRTLGVSSVDATEI
jgi:hypothetical protein